MAENQKPKAEKKKTRRVKLRAMQPIATNERLVDEGEVFIAELSALPPAHIAVPVDKTEKLGPPPPPSADELREQSKVKPPWTTAGYVDKANRRGEPSEEVDE